MSAAVNIAIPHERQCAEPTGRACGAACLSVVYGSFGREIAQTDIWPLIAKVNRFGQISSTTHLMVQDVLNRGFHAVAFQARHPFHVLRLCQAAGIRVILNHRPRPDSVSGHYSVLVDIDNKEVVLNDPYFGAARRLTHAQLLELWLSQVPNSEIQEGVVIGVSDATPTATRSCEFCHTSMPHCVDCPKCGNPTGLRPGEALGCIKDGCIARMWNWVCCPNCDYVFTFDAGVSPGSRILTARPQPQQAGSVPGVNIAKLFSALDDFTNRIQGIPGADDNFDIGQQIEFIEASKEKFKIAYAEHLTRRHAILAQLHQLTEKVNEQKQIATKKTEELQALPLPLDGSALGCALLKKLGVIA